MAYDLSTLGWKAFQDLSCAVAAEVMNRPVQTFLGSRDGGRDAAFLGTWEGDGNGPRKSTIQVKYLGGAGARLTLSKLEEELDKAELLAADGLADDYIIITNAGVTGRSEAEICAAFVKRGVGTCRVFHGEWIVEQIKGSARLRMLVPRVYGIGDLSHIVIAHAQEQARAILDEMGDELGCFVPTASYQAAVRALNDHRFVILLGDPASGKSTIAALLALGSIDHGCSGAVRISSPDQLSLWHPNEQQVLWVDDAFGANQLDTARINRWNSEFGLVRTAVSRGARVIFTSRNYIWAAARPNLRVRELPLLAESQVVVDVQELTPTERAQMLYNHVRRKQPAAMRRRLKPHLPMIAASPNFLPETARRLGDPFFTSRLEITRDRLSQLVDHPIEFLVEVLEGLDEASRAAIALIFLHPSGGVPSPIQPGEELDTVVRLTGRTPAEIARALEHLEDSLTRRVRGELGDRWTFRHPTISDAFATIVAASPELVEIYVRGARTERLVNEVVCAPFEIDGAEIRVPASLYPAVIVRLAGMELEEELKSFLGERCDQAFLSAFVAARPDVLEWTGTVGYGLPSYGGQLLLATLNKAGLLDEEHRRAVVDKLVDHAQTWCDTRILENKRLRALFTDAEWRSLENDFEKNWLDDLDDTYRRFHDAFTAEDERGLFTEFKEHLERAERYYRRIGRDRPMSGIYASIDEHLETLPGDDDDYQPRPVASPSRSAGTTASGPEDIFADIDE